MDSLGDVLRRKRLPRYGSGRMLLSMVFFSVLNTVNADPLVPDPTPAHTATVFIAGSPGNCISRSADIFFEPRVDYNPPVAESYLPPILRARTSYNVAEDPRYDWDNWLTRRGETTFITRFAIDPIGQLFTIGSDPLQSASGDEVLFIDLAAFYDDSEANTLGGFWANWHLLVMPIDLTNGFTLDDYLEFGEFETRLRGPFWSGEKFEVGDTDGGFAFRPQVMHYANLGIWNWSWSEHDTVRVFVREGDGGFGYDGVASFVVRRNETRAAPITLSDNGDVVSLQLADDGRLRRTKLNTSGVDSTGFPRVLENPDTHNVDVRFRTGTLGVPSGSAGPYGVGPYKLRGTGAVDFFPWLSGSFDQGSKILQFVDNITYAPGWDCAIPPTFDPFDVDDDFEFFLLVGPDGVNAQTNHGGCNDKTTVYLRASEVALPNDVIIGRTLPARVPNGANLTLSLPRNPSMHGVFFSELLSYQTAEDDDFGFVMTKQRTQQSFNLTVHAFDGNDFSAVAVRLTSLQWPACMPASVSSAPLSTRNMYTTFAHNVVDLPIEFVTAQYFVVHEILAYNPARDDDMSWTLYFEPLQGAVDFQLAASNAGTGIDAFVASEAQVIQFPMALGRPIAEAGPELMTVDCGCEEGALVQLSGAGSQANSQPGVSIDSIVRYTWRRLAGPGAVEDEIVGEHVNLEISLAAGSHEMQLTVEDECGNRDSDRIVVVVEDCGGTGDPDHDGIIDLDDLRMAVECLSGPTPIDAGAACQLVDFDCDGDRDLEDFGRFQLVFDPSH